VIVVTVYRFGRPTSRGRYRNDSQRSPWRPRVHGCDRRTGGSDLGPSHRNRL